MKKTVARSSLVLSVFCLLLSVWPRQPTGAWGTTGRDRPGAGVEAYGERAETSKILAAIGSRIDDPRAMETARNKLLLMDPEEIQLLSALSDRLASGDTAVGSSLAFFLITLLLALS